MLRTTIFAASLALAAASCFAAGDHAGGHGNGNAVGHAADQAVGQPGVAARATRTVQVDMADNMRFTPADIRVRQGETVRFVVKNSGALQHELVFGTEKALQAHHEAMKKHPGMAHAEPNMVTLAAGRSGELVWQFTQAGKVDFACLQPGHYEAGMKGAVRVDKAASQ